MPGARIIARIEDDGIVVQDLDDPATKRTYKDAPENVMAPVGDFLHRIGMTGWRRRSARLLVVAPAGVHVPTLKLALESGVTLLKLRSADLQSLAQVCAVGAVVLRQEGRLEHLTGAILPSPNHNMVTVTFSRSHGAMIAGRERVPSLGWRNMPLSRWSDFVNDSLLVVDPSDEESMRTLAGTELDITIQQILSPHGFAQVHAVLSGAVAGRDVRGAQPCKERPCQLCAKTDELLFELLVRTALNMGRMHDADVVVCNDRRMHFGQKAHLLRMRLKGFERSPGLNRVGLREAMRAGAEALLGR